MMKEIEVQIINTSNNELPKYAHEGDSGVDLYANERKIILANEIEIVKVGIQTAIPEGFEIQIRSRSGLALNHGIFVLNSPGTIDSKYRNEWGVILYNLGDSMFIVEKGDRIAQAILCPILKIRWKEVDNLPDSDRGLGGFGSTGK